MCHMRILFVWRDDSNSDTELLSNRFCLYCMKNDWANGTKILLLIFQLLNCEINRFQANKRHFKRRSLLLFFVENSEHKQHKLNNLKSKQNTVY